MTILRTEGADIYHQSVGKGEIVLFTHGFIATGEMWREQIRQVPDGWRFVTWDLRGHGRSSSPSDPSLYSEEDTVQDMKALLNHYRADQAVLVGHSLGGFMSLAFWLKYPERVRGMVLASSGPGYRDAGIRAEWNRIAEWQAERIEQNGLQIMEHYPELDESLHREPMGLIHAARGMMTQRDDRVINSLPDIDIPTLIVVGEHDKYYRRGSNYMASKIGHARHLVVKDAGHLSMMTDPGKFNRTLIEFLAELQHRSDFRT